MNCTVDGVDFRSISLLSQDSANGPTFEEPMASWSNETTLGESFVLPVVDKAPMDAPADEAPMDDAPVDAAANVAADAAPVVIEAAWVAIKL